MKTSGSLLLGGVFLLLSHGVLAGAPFEITEFMALNRETLNDEDGDSSDWIEIHNPDATAQSLEGWFLTDDPANLTRWRFPANVWLSAGEYLVVFASGKDKMAVPGRLHTNFRLDQDGEFLALLDPQTNIVSQFSPVFPPQSQDVSYGRDAVDPAITGFFPGATPGAQNVPGGPGFAPEVQFSRVSGTFVTNTPFHLELSVPAENAVIHYELGTNAPGTNSPLYAGPIPINNTVLVRARAFQPGVLPGPISARTYIGLANETNVVGFRSHLPIIVLHSYGQSVPLNKAHHTLLMHVFEPGSEHASLTNTPTMVERGTFHIRGDATLGYAKSSFTIEIRDELDEDKDVEVLGMPAESDWLLVAPNLFEPGIISNPLAYQLARDIGQYAPRTRLVEVYLKDDPGAPGPITSADYNGIYTLMEKIKRNPNRVDIDKLEPEHVTEPEISGGYLFTIDRAEANEPDLFIRGYSMRWVEPHPLQMTNIVRRPQWAYVTNYFDAFFTALQAPDYTNAQPGWANYIDVDSWVTRHVHEVLTFNIDALRLSTFLYKPRGGPLHFGPAFDYDRSQGGGGMNDIRIFNPRVWRSTTGDLGSDFFNHQPWWGRLFTAPDFWQRWIDRYQEFRQGPLALPNILNHIERFASEVRPAHAREWARWNVPPRSNVVSIAGFTHDFGNNGYENEVRWYGVWYSNRLHFMDTQFLARPILSRAGGGLAEPGEIITVYSTNRPGTVIYYTLDGTDPRAPGGGVSPAAFSANGSENITISNNVRLVARAWNSAHRNLTGPHNPPLSSPWSGPVSATFFTHIPALRITEIMYHPDDPESAEYLEVKNIGDSPLNVGGFTLSGAIDFTFPAVVLQPQQLAVVVADLGAFQGRYGSQALVLGAYSNRLDNAGERLVLRGAAQELILDFRYEDDWYPITDGFGFSLVVIDEGEDTTAWNAKAQWRASGAFHGSPGLDDLPGPALLQVVVSEVLGNTIELRNLSPTAANISGWLLTDDLDHPNKYSVPQGTIIPAGGYLTIVPSLSLNDLGDEIYLFSANGGGSLTGYFDGFEFGAIESGRSVGRYVISTGEAQYPALAAPTLGFANSAPLVGPVVITEIHYHPPDFILPGRIEDNTADEFVELRNITGSSVPLDSWRLSGAIEFVFPQNLVVPFGGVVLVVPFDTVDSARVQQFRARYGLPVSVKVLGPFHGKLDNAGASVDLLRPDAPRPNGLIPYILVDRVAYSDQLPWNGAANGLGLSLQRMDTRAYGNDPANWVAAAPSPGEGYEGGELPVITMQPQGQTVVAYNDASLSVRAAGTDLVYQWLFNGNPLPGATSSNLVLNNVQPSQHGSYSVAVFGSAGGIVSSTALLTVLMPATIIAQPQSVIANVGDNVSFSVNASSSTRIDYQWFHNDQEIPGATFATHAISDVDIEHIGLYRVRLTDSIGSVLSAPAILSLRIQPVIVNQPLSQDVPRGSTVTLSVEVTNVATLPVAYRWRLGGATVVSNLLHGFQDFLVVTNVQAVGDYTVAVYNIVRPGGILSEHAFVSPIDDSDQDGMPDNWEDIYDLDPGNAADAPADPDGDTLTNLDEYLAGTDPLDPLSYLKVRLVSVSPQLSQAILHFSAVSNRTYSIEYRSTLNAGPWQTLADIVAASSNRVVKITDPKVAASSRYYRLAIPRQP